MTMHDPVDSLLDFIDASPTAFQASGVIVQRLLDAGFQELREEESWRLEAGRCYLVRRSETAVVAFRPGLAGPAAGGFNLAVAHLDSPGLKIKLGSQSTGGAAKVAGVGIELYGSPIVGGWLDRELGVAGSVAVAGPAGVARRGVSLLRPLAIIPSLALHLNREVNKGFEYNPQTQLRAILGSAGEAGGEPLRKLLAEELEVAPEAILAADLFLVPCQPGRRCGLERELIVAPRLDNLAMCHAALTALLAAEAGEVGAVAMFYDHEEIGSTSLQGANSSLLETWLERLVLAAGGDREAWHRACARSFLISADMAHAVHPNFADKHDPAYAPVLNGGPVIKTHAGQKYAGNSVAEAYFAQLCRASGVTCQQFVARADTPPGSTVGPLVSARLGMAAVDVGTPMLAMHSVRETAGARDQAGMIEVLARFFRGG